MRDETLGPMSNPLLPTMTADLQRPLPVRRRTDLVIVNTGGPGSPRWTIKDPLTLRFHLLRDVDHFVFRQLDGRTSIARIIERFRKQWSPDRLSPEQILNFIGQLRQQGLVLVDRPGQAEGILARRRLPTGRRLAQGLSGLLAIRFRGMDPDHVLTRVLPAVGWMFSTACVVMSLFLMAAALVLFTMESDRFFRELPTFQVLSSPARIAPLLAVIAGVKVLHELGHAFACKKLGGEVRELGLMLLVFTPCLYCNVSDAWLLTSRRHRAAVGAAGIYVELLLATLATFLWLGSVPGSFHSLCLAVMVICSVNTLLLNGNPLLRYDGYHILADLVDVPNLRSRADQLVRGLVWRICCGASLKTHFSGAPLSRALLTVYGIAAGIYSWLVLIAILWMLHRVAETWHLEAAVVIFGAILILGRAAGTVTSFGNGLRSLSAAGQVRPIRPLIAVVLGASACWGLANLTLDRFVRAPLLIRPANEVSVFVTVPGRLLSGSLVPSGKTVAQGETLAALDNPELAGELIQLEGTTQRLTRQLEILEIRRGSRPEAADRIPSVKAALADAEQRLQDRRRDLDRLTIVAPQAGLVLAVPHLPDGRKSPLSREGDPLNPVNAESWLEVGMPLCMIADPRRREAVLYVDQADVSEIVPGLDVELTTSQTAGRRLHGIVTRVAPRPATDLPPLILISGDIAMTFGADGTPVPVSPVHEVRVLIDETELPPLPNQPGSARVNIGREALRDRMVRFLRRTFAFR